MDTISAKEISILLSKPKNFNITVLETATSTNTLLKEKAANGAEEGSVIIAKSQTDGRGRFTRKFFSPLGGIYMSILLRPDIQSFDATLVTTAAAVAVCEAIERFTVHKPQIKWVNDVLIDGKKVCGILTEASVNIKTGRLDHIVVGLGINVYPPENGFDDQIKDIAGAVAEKTENNLKNKLTSHILESFFDYYKQIEKKPHLSGYKSRCSILGKEITVIRGNNNLVATALDIDSNCRLFVQYLDGTKEYLSSGEISIKIQKQPYL